MRVLIVLGILVLSVGSVNAEYWFDDFDSYPAGPLDNQAGWGDSHSSVDVVATGADSPPNAVSLPVSSLSTRYAIYDEVDMAGGTILRTSFRLYRDNADQSFRMELRDGTTERLYISTSGGDITVSGTNTGVAYLSGVYATFTLFYNKSTDDVALDMNGTRILDWQDIGVASFSSIDNIFFRRASGTTDSGLMLIDNVSVQTIPDDAMAWWRFEEGTNSVAHEETGRFIPDVYNSQVGGGWETVPEALYTLFNGDDGVRNRHARINTRLNTIDQGANIDLGNNWTIEFIASFSGFDSCTLFEWTTLYPPATTTGAWIKVFWVSGSQRVHVQLRDDNAGVAEDVTYVAANVPRDGNWHHVAITKMGSALNGYVDYQNSTNYTLGTTTDGFYSFSAGCNAYIGQNSAGDDRAEGGIRFDEVRISDQVFLPDFLQIDHPRFSGIEVGATTCNLTFFGPPWVTCPIRSRTNMLSGSWVSQGAYYAPTNYLGEEKTVVIVKPSPERGFYDIR